MKEIEKIIKLEKYHRAILEDNVLKDLYSLKASIIESSPIVVEFQNGEYNLTITNDENDKVKKINKMIDDKINQIKNFFEI